MVASEIWVAGYPSLYGGADTELDHNIDLWMQFGIQVNLVPNGEPDAEMRKQCDQRGCRTHCYHPEVFKDKIVVSFCNGEFLERLPAIIENGKPAAVVWFNCMTYPFERELEAHRRGWISLFGFVSRFQRSQLEPRLNEIRPFQTLEDYRPFFNLANVSQQIEFGYRKPESFFAVGRISRDDGDKYSADMWRIFQKVCAPLPVKVFVLGFGPNAYKRTGSAPTGLDWQTWSPGEIPVRKFYETVHCIIHKTGGSRESYCRIVPEAYAAGVPIIVEDDFAFPELVKNGVTGFRCQSSDEMSYRASQLAFDEDLRQRMIGQARKYLLTEIASPERCWEPWKTLLS